MVGISCRGLCAKDPVEESSYCFRFGQRGGNSRPSATAVCLGLDVIEAGYPIELIEGTRCTSNHHDPICYGKARNF